MDEARATDGGEHVSLSETLPEAPPLGPRGTWASDHPVLVLVVPLASNLLFVGFLVSGISPVGFVLVYGLFFGLLGALAVLQAILRRLAARRTARLRAKFPREPWRYDHDWDERGQRRTWLVRIAETAQRDSSRFRWARVVAVAVFAGLAAAKQWSAMAVVGGALVTWISWAAWRLHGAGDAHLHFAKFPFHPGERVTLRFGMDSGGADFRRVEFRLSRVLQTGTVAVRIRPMSEFRPPGTLPGSDFDVEVSFDVPEGARGTELSGASPYYWVLDVLAATSSGPYAETFLIPIYDRPTSAADEPPLA